MWPFRDKLPNPHFYRSYNTVDAEADREVTP